MNIVLDGYRAIYVSIPKVACTSLRVVLTEVLDLDWNTSSPREWVHMEVCFPQVKKEDIARKFPGYFVFAFVRNPWDRLLSCFLDKTRPGHVEDMFGRYDRDFHAGMPFADFVEGIAAIPDEEADVHFGSQHPHLTSSDGTVFADFVGRFESLADDYAAVCERLGMPRTTLPTLMTSKHEHYSHYYTPKTRDLVADRFARDIELFGYEFNEGS